MTIPFRFSYRARYALTLCKVPEHLCAQTYVLAAHASAFAAFGMRPACLSNTTRRQVGVHHLAAHEILARLDEVDGKEDETEDEAVDERVGD